MKQKIQNEQVSKRYEWNSLLHCLTCATNMDCRSNLLRKALAMSGVGDREAIATSIPLALSACTIPLACG